MFQVTDTPVTQVEQPASDSALLFTLDDAVLDEIGGGNGGATEKNKIWSL
jgi:hypothetical protein